MKTLTVAICIFVISEMLNTCARAQNYPWCAYFTGGPVNCQFTTLEQCMEAIHGKTALCNQNAKYAPPANTQSNQTQSKTAGRRRHA
jgi:Protein of unknown function (DUF3551)